MALSPAKRAFVRHLVAVEMDRRDGNGKNGQGSAMTDAGFLDLLGGFHRNTATNWKRDPEVQAAVKRAVEEMEASADYFKTMLAHRVLEEMFAQYQKATGPEKRHYLKMLREETKGAIGADQSVNYEDLTDEDLANACLEREVTPLGMTHKELVALAKKGASDELNGGTEGP